MLLQAPGFIRGHKPTVLMLLKSLSVESSAARFRNFYPEGTPTTISDTLEGSEY